MKKCPESMVLYGMYFGGSLWDVLWCSGENQGITYSAWVI